MPSKRNTATNNFNDGIALWARPLLWAGGTLLSKPRDSALAIAAGVAAGAILINSLYLQPGPHPAPIFAFKHSPIAADTPPKPDRRLKSGRIAAVTLCMENSTSSRDTA